MKPQNEPPILIVYDDENLNADAAADIHYIGRRTEQQLAVEDWLQPTAYSDPAGEYAKHLRSHVSGTGDWLLSNKKYRQWHDSPNGECLWIKAVPGAGKSVIAARVRARLALEEPECPALFFFFRHIIAANRHPTQLVRDWLSQMVASSDVVCEHIQENMIAKRRALDTIGFDEFWGLLCQAIQVIPKTYLFVDALDEMEKLDEHFLARLVSLSQYSGCKVFITSRPNPEIVNIFRPLALLVIDLAKVDVQQDIGRYVDHRLDGDIRRYIQLRLSESNIRLLGDDTKKASLECLIRDTLQQKARGSFLYARLMMDALLETFGAAQKPLDQYVISSVLDDVPVGLSNLYDQMLLEHSRRSGVSTALQALILQWVTHSQQPLRVLELAAVICHDTDGAIDLKDAKILVRRACGPLLEILPSDVVGPIHHSFTEWLVSSSGERKEAKFPCMNSSMVHRDIAHVCVKYMLEIYDSTNLTISLSIMKEKHPLLDYAFQHWNSHCSNCQDDSELSDLLDSFLVNKSAACHVWASQHLSQNIISMQEMMSSNRITPLHLSAMAGLGHHIAHLIQKGDQDVNAQIQYVKVKNFSSVDSEGRTALHFAAASDHSRAAEALVKHGANVVCHDHRGLTPLHLAVVKDSRNVVRLLLQAGVSPLVTSGGDKAAHGRIPSFDSNFRAGPVPQPSQDLKDGEWQTPLWLCLQGKSQILRMFLPSLTDEQVTECLFDALWLRHLNDDVCELLAAEPRLLVNHLSRNQTLLFAAAASRKTKCVRILLDRGADTALLSDYFEEHSSQMPGRRPSPSPDAKRSATPLHGLYQPFDNWKGQLAGKDISDLVNEITQALHAAGCDLNVVDKKGRTALSYARRYRWAVLPLLDCGASLHGLLTDGVNPLRELIWAKDIDKDAFLWWLQKGIDIDFKDERGRTVFHNCVEYCMGESGMDRLEWVLKHKPDVNATDYLGNNALHILLARGGDVGLEITELLLKIGVSTTAQNADGDTPAHRISDASALKLYLEYGGDLEIPNLQGKSVLLTCVSRPNFLFRTLKEMLPLVNIKAVDHRGANAIHCAVERVHQAEVVESLVEGGIDPTARDAAGNGLWHYAIKGHQKLDYERYMTWANPSIANNHGQTIVHVSTVCSPYLQVLCGSRAVENVDINHIDSRGNAAIHLAAATSLRAVRTLHGLGASLWGYTHSSNTVLHFAAVARMPDILAYLVDQAIATGKSDLINHRDTEGWSALAYAVRSGRFESVQVLLDAGAYFDSSMGVSAATASFAFHEEQELWRKLRERSFEQHGDIASEVVSLIQQPSFGLMARGLGSLARAFRRLANYPRGSRITQHQSFKRNTEERPVSIELCQTYLAAVQGRFSPPAIALKQDGGDAQRTTGAIDFASTTSSLTVKPTADASVRSLHASTDELLGDRQGRDFVFLRERFETLICTGRDDLLRHHLFDVQSLEAVDSKTSPIRWPKSLSALNLNLGGNSQSSGYASTYSERRVRYQGHHTSSGYVTIGMRNPFEDPWQVLYNTEESDLEGHEDPGFQADDEIFTGNLRGLLFLASQPTEMPNTRIVQTVIQEMTIDEEEKVWAMFQLSVAERHWQTQALEFVVKHVRDVNTRDPSGRTALHVACMGSHKSISSEFAVRILLQHGADPNILDSRGSTCLNKATWNTQIVQMLLEHGADIHLGAPWCLIRAIRAQNASAVDLILKQGVDVNARFMAQQTSSQQNQRDAIKQVEQGQFNTGSSSRDALISQDEHHLAHSYPLHYATATQYNSRYSLSKQARVRRKAVIKTLLDAGADPNIMLDNGNRLLSELLNINALYRSILRQPTVDLLTRDVNQRNLLSSYFSIERVSPFRRRYDKKLEKHVDELIECGIDLSEIDAQGCHVLHHMAKYTQFGWTTEMEKVFKKILLRPEVRALINIADHEGILPIHYFIQKKNWRFTKLLVSLGATLKPDTNGNTIFHTFGAHPGDLPEVAPLDQGKFAEEIETELRFIRALGADPNATNQAGELPLLLYLRSCPRNDRVWESRLRSFNRNDPSFTYNQIRLRRRKADDDGAQQVPKHHRGYFSFIRGIEMLINVAGMDPLKKDGNGRNALHVLASCTQRCRQGRSIPEGESVVHAWKYLTSLGLDPRQEDEQQATALDIASLNKNSDILDLYDL